MVLVNCPLKQNDIIKLIEEYKVNDENVFSLKSKKGVQLYFDSKINNDDKFINVIFHCARSQQRGPSAALKLLRSLNDDDINKIKILILRGGFNHWQEIYGNDDTVTEDYIPSMWEW